MNKPKQLALAQKLFQIGARAKRKAGGNSLNWTDLVPSGVAAWLAIAEYVQRKVRK